MRSRSWWTVCSLPVRSSRCIDAVMSISSQAQSGSDSALEDSASDDDEASPRNGPVCSFASKVW